MSKQKQSADIYNCAKEVIGSIEVKHFEKEAGFFDSQVKITLKNGLNTTEITHTTSFSVAYSALESALHSVNIDALDEAGNGVRGVVKDVEIRGFKMKNKWFDINWH